MIIINLTDLQSLPKTSPHYVRFRQPYRGDMCGEACPESPHYKCTRTKGHKEYRGRDDSYNNHIAHGVDGKVFAVWNDGDRD